MFAAWGDTDVPFNDSSVAPAPYDRTRVLEATPFGSKYPGAIQAASRDVDTPGAWFRGDRDRDESENYVIEGNPFDVSRLAAPQAAGACTDDEANDMEMDIDEQNANQVRSRNDETRVVAGTMNRRRWLDPYLREELDEEEYGVGAMVGKARDLERLALHYFRAAGRPRISSMSASESTYCGSGGGFFFCASRRCLWAFSASSAMTSP